MIIFGAGSFSKILFLLFTKNFANKKKRIICDSFSSLNSQDKQFWLKHDFKIISSAEIDIYNFSPDKFVVAIGNEYGFERLNIIEYFLKKDNQMKNFQHESAFIHKSSFISDETIIMPKVTIMPLTKISRGCIVNTSATIDHEVNIEKGCHIMGSSYIAGRVNIGEWTTIGSNSTVFPDITIGKNCFIGAGSIVKSNIPDESIVIGQPAKFLKRSRILPSSHAVLKNNKLI